MKNHLSLYQTYFFHKFWLIHSFLVKHVGKIRFQKTTCISLNFCLCFFFWFQKNVVVKIRTFERFRLTSSNLFQSSFWKVLLVKSKKLSKKIDILPLDWKKVFIFTYNKQISSWKVVWTCFSQSLINSCEKHVQTTFHEEISIYHTLAPCNIIKICKYVL